jgi:uncharacterized protein YqgV (UPF0045/DUF77 family)
MFLKKPYKTTDEFYKAVEKLIKLLQEHGFEEEAKNLGTILHGVWTTGSELIGELMLFLEKTNVALPKDVKKLKNDCLYFARHHRKILGLD